MSISPEIYNRIRALLLNCWSFASDDELRAIFVDARINAWADQLPETKTRADRVNATVYLLADQHTVTNENALVLFLRVLCDQTAPENQCHHRLAQLASILEQHPQHLEELQHMAQSSISQKTVPTKRGCYFTSVKFSVAIVFSLGFVCSVGFFISYRYLYQAAGPVQPTLIGDLLSIIVIGLVIGAVLVALYTIARKLLERAARIK